MEKVILVTNDDGINAGGIKALVEAVKDLGRVVVVAPAHPQSAKGWGITITEPLYMRKVNTFGEDIEAYEATGTPADCVKLAKAILFKGENPAICVSGINHGSNAAINIVYSGTVSGAKEASLEDINAIAFSLLDWSEDANFEPCKPFVQSITKDVLENGLPERTLLNVNVPLLPVEEIKGFKVCRQAHSKWIEEFEIRKDHHGNECYWLHGEFVNQDAGKDTDIHYLEEGYVSVVPVHVDHTAHNQLESMKNRFENE
jgi:5'-nucleotidase